MERYPNPAKYVGPKPTNKRPQKTVSAAKPKRKPVSMSPKAQKAYKEISQATYANLMTKREKSMGKSPSASTRRVTAMDRKYEALLKAGELSSSPPKMYDLKRKAIKQGEKRYASSVKQSSLKKRPPAKRKMK